MNKAVHNESALFIQLIQMKSSFKIFWLSFLFLFSFSAFADNVKEGMRLFNAGKYQQAMMYFMKPDARKNPDVLNHIAHMYDKGLGVEKNLQISAQWYKKAAEMGFKVAQFNLGLCYEKGEGVTKDIHEAIYWFRKSAEQEYADAESKMGYLTVTGKGIKQDFAEAMRWYRLAAEHGDISSYAAIGLFYAQGNGVKKDKNRAVQYYIMGAEKGDAYAQYLLGWAYYKGFGVQSDGDRSIYWLTKAAENGSARAMDKLAVIYGNGLVYEERDREAGRKWAEKAWQTRKRTGESDPEVDRRLRFFGIDPDDL